MVSVQCLNILWSAHWHPSIFVKHVFLFCDHIVLLWYICLVRQSDQWPFKTDTEPISNNTSMCTVSVYKNIVMYFVVYLCETSSCMSHPVRPCSVSLCPSYCLWAWDSHCADVAVIVSVCQLYFSFYFEDEFVLVLFVLHFIQHCFGTKSILGNAAHLFHSSQKPVMIPHSSIHFIPFISTPPTPLMPPRFFRLNNTRKKKSTAGFPLEVVMGTTFYLDDT